MEVVTPRILTRYAQEGRSEDGNYALWSDCVKAYRREWRGRSPLRTLRKDISYHLAHGVVYRTDSVFVLARPVCRCWSEAIIRNPANWNHLGTADTWHVTYAAGDLRDALWAVPYPLPFISFERGDGRLRFYDYQKFEKRLRDALS